MRDLRCEGLKDGVRDVMHRSMMIIVETLLITFNHHDNVAFAETT